MRSRTPDFKKQKLNLDHWQKLYYQKQQSYLRARLLAIKFLAEGKTRTEVSRLMNCTYKTLTSWIDKYLEGGLEKLTEPIKHQVPLYEIIGELNLSYQRSHRDYANADKIKQKQFIELLKKTKN